MRHYAVYNQDDGEILLRITTNGQPPADSIELTNQEANAEPPVEKTHKVDIATKKLKVKPGHKDPREGRHGP